MLRRIKNRGMGWLPDLPDFRDYQAAHPKVAPMLKKTSAAVPVKAGLPSSADLRQWRSPIVDQGPLGSCTANAAAGMVEYFEKERSETTSMQPVCSWSIINMDWVDTGQFK